MNSPGYFQYPLYSARIPKDTYTSVSDRKRSPRLITGPSPGSRPHQVKGHVSHGDQIRTPSAHNKEDRNETESLTQCMECNRHGHVRCLAAVLMIFEVPLPFIAPSFYGMDISECRCLWVPLPQPVAGVVMGTGENAILRS